MEVQRAQRSLVGGGAALRLRLRGYLSAASDREGPQSRQCLVLDARQRMAGAQGCLRALARAGEFRRGGTAADRLERVERRALGLAPRPAKRGEGFPPLRLREQRTCIFSSPAP